MLITYPLTLASAHSQSLASKSSPYPANSQDLDYRIIDWLRVSDLDHDNYCEYIRQHIPALSDSVVSCCDPNCRKHYMFDTDCSQLLNCLAVGTSRCLPKFRSNHSIVPGWNLQARSFWHTANFWYKLWCDCSSPTSGVLFQIKKRTKRRYKYEVRRLKRQKEHLKYERIGKALSQSRNRDF